MGIHVLDSRTIDRIAAGEVVERPASESLFDFVGEEEKKDYEIKVPDVTEYTKEELLGYEKEILIHRSTGILLHQEAHIL